MACVFNFDSPEQVKVESPAVWMAEVLVQDLGVE